MQIEVKLFAILRERAGVEHTTIELKPGAKVADAAEVVAERLPVIRPLLGRLAFAVNRSYVPRDTELSDGDELALIPPVSGG